MIVVYLIMISVYYSIIMNGIANIYLYIYIKRLHLGLSQPAVCAHVY